MRNTPANKKVYGIHLQIKKVYGIHLQKISYLQIKINLFLTIIMVGKEKLDSYNHEG